MKVNFNLPGPKELFSYKTNQSDPKIMSQKLKEAKTNLKENITEADILSYFYNHFYGQIRVHKQPHKAIPEAELNISIKREIYFQTIIDGAKENSDKLHKNNNFSDEKVSDKLFESIKELGGNNPKTIEKLKNTMINAYKKVEKEVGKMPEISKSTLNKAIQKTNNYLTKINSNHIDTVI